MALRTLFLTFATLLTLETNAHAYVTVLREKRCGDNLESQKSTEGIRTSLAKDPTTLPVQIVSPKIYREEAYGTIEVVHEVYREIFKNMHELKKLPEDPDIFMNRMIKTDQQRFEALNAEGNGRDNTVYFIGKYANGKPGAIIRATLIRKGEKRKLSLEKSEPFPDANRVELERALNSPGSRSDIIFREILMVMAKYFQNYFGSDDYLIGLKTDAGRARTYRMKYGFEYKELSDEIPMLRYLCKISGSDFYYRWQGHVDLAYTMAFSGRYDSEGALEFLREFESQPGMHDYIPNLVAQSAILASQRKYKEALEMTEHLKKVGYAEINLDYNVLWHARLTFDNIFAQGNADESLKIVQDYLTQQPLDYSSYNERALLFTIFQLKTFLAAERYDDAAQLVSKARDVLTEGLKRQQGIYDQQWSWIQSTYRISNSKPSEASRARLQGILLMWDISTHLDFFSTAAMRPETYWLASDEAERLGHHAESLRFKRNAEWLQKLRLAPASKPRSQVSYY